MADRSPSQLAGRFSERVFGRLPPPIDRSYFLKNGFHVLDCDPPNAFDKFCLHGPAAMAGFLACLDSVLGDMIENLARRRSPSLTVVKEGLWVFAYEQEIVFDCRLSRAHRAHLVASPSYALIRNLDSVPVKFKRFRFGPSFEAASARLDQVGLGCLMPGEEIVVDGFREALAWAEDGVLLAAITTFPRGAYDAIFALEDGRRVGSLSSELRTASLGLALRMFAAAGWRGADKLSDLARHSPLRELRWAALNFDWQSNSAKLETNISTFRADPDSEIAQLAEFCFAELRREQAETCRAGALA